MKLKTAKIKVMLCEKRMTITDLARIAGTTRQNMSNIILRGSCNFANAGRIADALGVDVLEIVKEY